MLVCENQIQTALINKPTVHVGDCCVGAWIQPLGDNKVQGSNSFSLPKTEETKGTKNIIRVKETPIKAARSR